VKNKNNC